MRKVAWMRFFSKLYPSETFSLAFQVTLNRQVSLVLLPSKPFMSPRRQLPSTIMGKIAGANEYRSKVSKKKKKERPPPSIPKKGRLIKGIKTNTHSPFLSLLFSLPPHSGKGSLERVFFLPSSFETLSAPDCPQKHSRKAV